MNKRNMLLAVIIAVPLVMKSGDGERPLTLKERMALLELARAQDAASRGGLHNVGKFQNPTGYVDKSGAVVVDFARQRTLQDVRKAIEDIELDTVRDALSHVKRRRNEEPRADLKPHVNVLLKSLEGLSEQEKLVIIEILQNELALKAAARVL